MPARAQVFGGDDEPLGLPMRPASKKRQGTKSRTAASGSPPSRSISAKAWA